MAHAAQMALVIVCLAIPALIVQWDLRFVQWTAQVMAYATRMPSVLVILVGLGRAAT
jgi:hypothetical protein